MQKVLHLLKRHANNSAHSKNELNVQSVSLKVNVRHVKKVTLSVHKITSQKLKNHKSKKSVV